MSSISIAQLKKQLASILKRARRAGRPVVITRHNRPVAYLIGKDHLHVHWGNRSEPARLRSILKAPSHGRYLEVLAEDRAENDLRPGP